MSVYVCPVCGSALVRTDRTFKCENRHSYDISAAGYVNLSPPSAGSHGDDREMVDARRAFLGKGHYAPLCDGVCEAVRKTQPRVLLDAGCGEGYYTRRICDAFPGAAVYGIDISKKAAEKAAKLCRGASVCVASVYRMPYSDNCFDCAVNVFSPLAADEYRRVIKPGGGLVMAVPTPDHLIELKRAVYDSVIVKEMKDEALDGFELCDSAGIRFSMDLDGEDLKALFTMTPYYHKTSYEDKARIDGVRRLSVTASFTVFRYKKL